MKFQKILLVLCVFVLCASVCNILPIHGEEMIYESVVRLHVLANSDSDEDQALKLRVRDAVLEHISPLVRYAKSRDEAAQILSSELESIKKAASAAIAECGFDSSVDVSLTFEDYPTRNYESMAFPSGEYLSLRVMIGEAKGKNWWCVLFPPLCLGTATDKIDAEDAFLAVGLNADQYKIITENDEATYYLRFKLLETLERIGE